MSISHRCHLFEVAFVWELTKETMHLPLGCLQGGCFLSRSFLSHQFGEPGILSALKLTNVYL